MVNENGEEGKNGDKVVNEDMAGNVAEEELDVAVGSDEEVEAMEIAAVEQVEQGAASYVGPAVVGNEAVVGQVVDVVVGKADKVLSMTKARASDGRIILVDTPALVGAYMYQSTLDGLVYKGRNKYAAKKSCGGKVDILDTDIPGASAEQTGGGGSSARGGSSPDKGESLPRSSGQAGAVRAAGPSVRQAAGVVAGGGAGGTAASSVAAGVASVPALCDQDARAAAADMAATVPSVVHRSATGVAQTGRGGPPGFPALPVAPFHAFPTPRGPSASVSCGLLRSHGTPPPPASGAFSAAAVRAPRVPVAATTAPTAAPASESVPSASGSLPAAPTAAATRQQTGLGTRYTSPPGGEAALAFVGGSLPRSSRWGGAPGRASTPPPSPPRWSGPPPQRWTGALTPPPRRGPSPVRASTYPGGAAPAVPAAAVAAMPLAIFDLVDTTPGNTPPASPVLRGRRGSATESALLPSSRSPSPRRPGSGKRRRRGEGRAALAEAMSFEDVAQLIKTGLASVRAELTRVKAELVVVKAQAASTLRKVDALAASADADTGAQANVLERMAALERMMVDMRGRLSVNEDDAAAAAKARGGGAGLAKNDAVVMVNKVKVFCVPAF